MRITLIAALAGLALSACAQSRNGSQHAVDPGPQAERSYAVAGFDKIEVAGPYQVFVRTGPGHEVRASGPSNRIDRMIVEVSGDTLKIRPRRDSGFKGWSGGDPVRLDVTLPALRAARLAGSGRVTVDRIAGDSFDGGIAGSGDLDIGTVEVGLFNVSIAGSGDVKAGSGTAAKADYTIAGSGGMDLAGITATDASVSVMGSGDIRARATGTATVRIAGSGDVAISGGARCTVSKAGSGNVECG